MNSYLTGANLMQIMYILVLWSRLFTKFIRYYFDMHFELNFFKINTIRKENTILNKECISCLQLKFEFEISLVKPIFIPFFKLFT